MTTPTPLGLREIAEADVYLGDDLVAHLVRGQRDTISFDYVPDQHSADASVRDQSASWSLLRTDRYPVITTGGAVPAFFAAPQATAAARHG